MKFIKKHRSIVVLGAIVVAVALAAFIFKDTISFDETTAVYGNRLDGIDAVKITKEQKQQVKDVLKDVSESAEVRVAGKLVNIIIETMPETDLAAAKAWDKPVLAVFTEEQKKFYDFQFLIDNSENQQQYPIIGYKQHSRDGVNWTKDRPKTEG